MWGGEWEARQRREKPVPSTAHAHWLLFSQGRRLEKPSARSGEGRVWAEG